MKHFQNELPESPQKESMFHADVLGLISSTFSSNLSYYRNYQRDDELAELLLGGTMDIIDCTFYTVRKSHGETRKKITDTLSEVWSEGVNGSHLLEEMLDPLKTVGIVEDNSLLLELLREKYTSLVRSPFDRCWLETTKSVAAGLDKCQARTNGCRVESAAGEIGRTEQCSRFYSSWRRSILALEDQEELCNDPKMLSAKIREQCRLLSLLAVPERLEAFLSSRCSPAAGGSGGRRTVRGVIVRILSLLADECFISISRMVNLPPEQYFYLSRLPS